jgi:hypothetical protein
MLFDKTIKTRCHTTRLIPTLTENTEIVNLLLKAGASLSVVDNDVNKPSVKLRESNIKLFK